MRKHNRFASGSGVYQCVDCGKMTRETGSGESDLQLCKHCLEQGEWDNFISDGGDPEEVPAEYRRSENPTEAK